MSFQRIRKENNQPKNQQPNQETDQQQQQQCWTIAKCKVNLLLTFHFVHGICLPVFFAFLCFFSIAFFSKLCWFALYYCALHPL